MNSEIFILVINLVVILTYLIDILCYKIKIPSILFLIILGIIFRIICDKFKFNLDIDFGILPIIGTIALIFIVLEGGLELKLSHKKIKIIKKSLLSSVTLLFLTSFSLAFLFNIIFHKSFYQSLVNAIPLSVISSAIAIPSVKKLESNYQEFVVYESSLSDVFGILFFNFLITTSYFGFRSFLALSGEIIIIGIMSIILTVLLSYLIGRINHHIKFLPILSLILISYSIAKIFHFSPLIFILIFGLFLNNIDLIIGPKIEKLINTSHLIKEISIFRKLVTELTFIFKSIFFILFGYLTIWQNLIDIKSILIALVIVIIIFSLRYVLLKFVFNYSFLPLTLIAPRGLITILLALSIPFNYKINELKNSILVWTIFFTVLVLTFNIIIYRDKNIKIPFQKN